MIGSFLTRGLVMVFGYAYPAYECYKTVEKNRPEIENLRFWCQYWILVAVLTVCERVGDAFISWVPMYSEAKLAFFIYLWYPKTKGTTYVYDSFFKPYVSKHENEIDRNLLELRTRAGDMAILYWQRAASYGQTRIYEILQFVAAQSTPRTRPPQSQPQQQQQQKQQPNGRVRPTPPPKRQPAKAQPETEEPPSPTSSTSSSQDQKEVAEEVGPSQVPKAAPPTAAPPAAAPPAAAANTQKATAPSETTSQTTPTEAQPMQIEATPPSSTEENTNPPPPETVIDESIRVTRGRLRKTRSTGNR
ncbi:putative HVA22-like protein g [Castanea sativa]|uniref:putative HVA22-like protein g n=1 Tax=Castanea sativa TaxID=21020 RepID=UPI003F64E71F